MGALLNSGCKFDNLRPEVSGLQSAADPIPQVIAGDNARERKSLHECLGEVAVGKAAVVS